MKIANFEEIKNLIRNRIEESNVLDFKQQLNDSKDNDEIAKDISALANTEGGTIIYGISEEDKVPVEITWITDVGVEERIQNILSNTVHPRLNGIEILRINNSDNSKEAIYVVNVIKSVNAPHMVTKRHNYYIRRGSTSIPMEDADVRSSFFKTGLSAALKYEISENVKLVDSSFKLIYEVIESLKFEKRQPIVLEPFHTEVWNAVITSGLLLSMNNSLVPELVELYSNIFQINSLISWINAGHWPMIVHTTADPSSARAGIYLPAILQNKLPPLGSKLKSVEGKISEL